MFGLTPLATLSLAMALASIVTKPVISEAIWHMHCLASRLILTPVGRLCAMIRVTLVVSKTERRCSRTMGGAACALVASLTTTAAGVGCVGCVGCSGGGDGGGSSAAVVR